MEHRQERLLIETDRHRIRGAVTLARDGFRSRISDMLNAAERDFIALTDVTIEPLDGGADARRASSSRSRARRSSSRCRSTTEPAAAARAVSRCDCGRRL